MNKTQAQVWLLIYPPEVSLEPKGGWLLSSTYEQKRLTAIRHEDTRTQFALTRLLIRWILNNQFGSITQEWSIGYDKNGRPQFEHCFADAPDISISHTNGMVAFAMANKGRIGVDVENHSRGVDIQLLSREVFSKEELAHFEMLSPPNQQKFFFQHWTLKEAYTKALGLGLYAGFNSIDIGYEVNTDTIYLKAPASDDNHLPHAWSFYHSLHFTSFHVAIAQLIDNCHPQTTVWQINPTLIEIAGFQFNAMRLSLNK
jgi:4'-phosphopantetheinyl transferase